jgi:glycosyltransferase involved in cell wall biosynthesis
MSLFGPALRVLLIDHAPIIGGVERMIGELLGALDPAQVAPVIVTDTHSPMRGRFSAVYPEIALPLTRLKRNPFAAFSLISSAWQVARVARRRRASVIQTFTARTHLIGALAGAMARVPVVWRLNDDTLYHALALALGRIPRRIIAVSAHLRLHYSAALRVTDVIPDGVPIPPLTTQAKARRTLNLPLDAKIIVLAARMARWKGHAVFLRALRSLIEHDPSVLGIMVGGYSEADNVPGPLGGGEPYQRELIALAHELGLTEHVLFTGQAPSTLPYFAAADVVVHTSLLPEPFGRVLIEAMAAARPVVAVDAGGPREIVVPQVTGLLTPPGDAPALAEALMTLLKDSELRTRMGLAGRARAEREYSLACMAQRLTEVWRQTARS